MKRKFLLRLVKLAATCSLSSVRASSEAGCGWSVEAKRLSSAVSSSSWL
jgi:hypothetical protein